jgi:hypothetical protein
MLKGKSGDTVNIGHKTKNEDKLNIKTTWKTKKTRNTDPTKNPEMDPLTLSCLWNGPIKFMLLTV